MKIDKRIQQTIQYNIKEIKIKKEVYRNLKDETKAMLKLNKVKITFDENVKELEFNFKQGGTKMFIKKEEYNNLINRINELEKNQFGQDELYKFYLERKLEEINNNLKHEITFEVKEKVTLITTVVITIKLGTKTIKEMYLGSLYTRVEKEVLHYLNSKNKRYFIKLDRKLTEAEKEIDNILEKEK